MKKIIKSLCILSLAILTLVGCSGVGSSSDESNAKKAAKTFGEEFYTVSSKKIDDYNTFTVAAATGSLQATAEALQSNDKILKSLMTEKEFNNLATNRYDTVYEQACAKANYTMQVTDFTLTKDYYDSKNNTAGYYFNVKLKFIATKDKTERTDATTGYIGLTKENGQWKVSVSKMDTIPKLILEDFSK